MFENPGKKSWSFVEPADLSERINQMKLEEEKAQIESEIEEHTDSVKVEYEAWKTKNIPASPISPANPGKIISNISGYLGLLALLPHQPQNEFPGKVKAGMKKFLDARGRKYPEGKKSISIIRDQNAIDRMCHTLMDEHRELQNKTKNLSSKNTEYQSQVSQLVLENKNLSSDKTNCQSQVSQLKSEKKNLSSKNTECQSQVSRLEKEKEEFSSKNTECRSQVSQLEKEKENLSSKNTEFQSRVSQLETSLRMKDDEIAELQRQAEDLSLNKRDCLTQFEEYKSEILELKSKCENLLSENQNLSQPTNSYSSYFRSAINTGLMMYALYTIWTERSTEMSESARQELRGKLF
jgi:DNA repair exonuclease SbcCD ATPase subunit